MTSTVKQKMRLIERVFATCRVVGAIVSTVKRPVYGVVCALMGGPAVVIYFFGLFQMERARMQTELETPLPATLRHAHDANVERICGATSPGKLDEHAFVLRATGLAP